MFYTFRMRWNLSPVDLLIIKDHLVDNAREAAGGAAGNTDHHDSRPATAQCGGDMEEIGIPGDQHEGLNVRISERNLQAVQAHLHIDAVFDPFLAERAAPGGNIDRLDSRLVQIHLVPGAPMIIVLPVGISAGDNGAAIAFLDSADQCGDIGQTADFIQAVFEVLPINKKGNISLRQIEWGHDTLNSYRIK